MADIATQGFDYASLRTISLPEAGKLLGIGRNRAYEMAKDGSFPVPVLDVAGKLRVRVQALEAWLDAQSVTPTSA